MVGRRDSLQIGWREGWEDQRIQEPGTAGTGEVPNNQGLEKRCQPERARNGENQGTLQTDVLGILVLVVAAPQL